MTRTVRHVTLLLAVLSTGCRPKPEGPTVAVHLDEGPARTVAVGTEAVPLASALPKDAADPETWRFVEAHSADGRFLEFRQPAASYPGVQARLWVDAKGRPTFAFFRPVNPDLPPAVAAIARQPIASLTDVKEIRVRTRPPEEPSEAPVRLSIRVPGEGPAEFTGKDLAGLAERTGARPRERGWSLADVAALRMPPERIARIQVQGKTEALIEGKALTDPGRRLFLKRNKKGELVFQEWVGDQPDAATVVREVESLRIETIEGEGAPGASPDDDDGP